MSVQLLYGESGELVDPDESHPIYDEDGNLLNGTQAKVRDIKQIYMEKKCCILKVKGVSKIIALFHILLFTKCGVNDVEMGGGYVYHEDIKAILSETNNQEIPSVVESYSYNDNYIIAKQKPSVYADVIYTYSDSFSGNRYALGLDTSYFWIIQKETGDVFGPLLKTEFEHICDSLHVKLEFF